MVANTEANGRFHSDWLSMLYPRLKLAKNLLADDGAIFVSIDDHEVAQSANGNAMRFSVQENFVATLIWQKKRTARQSQAFSRRPRIHSCVYARNADLEVESQLPTKRRRWHCSYYKNPDNDPRRLVESDRHTSPESSTRHSIPIRRSHHDPDDESLAITILPPKLLAVLSAARNVEQLVDEEDDLVEYQDGDNDAQRVKQILSEVERRSRVSRTHLDSRSSKLDRHT